MKKIIILGAGMVGKAMAIDLSTKYKVKTSFKYFEVVTNISIFAFRFEKSVAIENNNKMNRSCMWQMK